MRRLFISTLVGFAFIGGGIGCCHTHGVCDCDPPDNSCCGTSHHDGLIIAEPIHAMPSQSAKPLSPGSDLGK